MPLKYTKNPNSKNISFSPLTKIVNCNCHPFNKKSEDELRFFAERQGFEPWVPEKGTTVFETAPIDHSGIFPFSHFDGAKISFFGISTN